MRRAREEKVIGEGGKQREEEEEEGEARCVLRSCGVVWCVLLLSISLSQLSHNDP